MRVFKKNIFDLVIILAFGAAGSLICQLFTKDPADRFIHIRNFRYGKDPSVIRCNRGDRLHLTFSSEDTGHSFFLEEFDTDAKVSPANEEVSVFRPSDPSVKPVLTKELIITAKHPGILNYIISKNTFRCHVWCGPLHAFEQGKLIILPNTLLAFSLGCLLGIICLGLISFFNRYSSLGKAGRPEAEGVPVKDILGKSSFLKKGLFSRWPQIIMIILGLVMIYIVIMTTFFGTKVSGRNLGVLLMWAVWLFILVGILTPLAGRAWCTICPLPFFGDWIQRRSFFSPEKGPAKGYYNKFYGLSLKWPEWLNNSWLRLMVFMILTTFSITLVATPKVSGYAILSLVLIPTVMAGIWELRAFCRYVCPVTVFMTPFSGLSLITLKNKNQAVCDKCKPHFCQKGSATGWACPYGINVGEMKTSTDCGLCLECLRSCSYKNVSVFRRPFGSDTIVRNMSEAWLSIGIFLMAIIYSIIYLGPWPEVRDYVNIIDKHNWDLFTYYAIVIWISVLLVFPGLLYLLALFGKKISKTSVGSREVFFSYTACLLPLGLMFWISFVIPMLFTNFTFILQAASDPFGWGWDFFGTANIPWHQLLPEFIPWFQGIVVLTGFYLSFRHIRNSWNNDSLKYIQQFRLALPFLCFVTMAAVFMLYFYTN